MQNTQIKGVEEKRCRGSHPGQAYNYTKKQLKERAQKMAYIRNHFRRRSPNILIQEVSKSGMMRVFMEDGTSACISLDKDDGTKIRKFINYGGLANVSINLEYDHRYMYDILPPMIVSVQHYSTRYVGVLESMFYSSK